MRPACARSLRDRAAGVRFLLASESFRDAPKGLPGLGKEVCLSPRLQEVEAFCSARAPPSLRASLSAGFLHAGVLGGGHWWWLCIGGQ